MLLLPKDWLDGKGQVMPSHVYAGFGVILSLWTVSQNTWIKWNRIFIIKYTIFIPYTPCLYLPSTCQILHFSANVDKVPSFSHTEIKITTMQLLQSFVLIWDGSTTLSVRKHVSEEPRICCVSYLFTAFDLTAASGHQHARLFRHNCYRFALFASSTKTRFACDTHQSSLDKTFPEQALSLEIAQTNECTQAWNPWKGSCGTHHAINSNSISTCRYRAHKTNKQSIP